MDVLSSQANLAGYRAVIEGAYAFQRGFLQDGPNVLVSSRKPADLDAFCREIVRAFAATPVHARR